MWELMKKALMKLQNDQEELLELQIELLKRVRDFAQVKADGFINKEIAQMQS